MKRTRWVAALAGLAVAAVVTIPGTVSSAAPGDPHLTFINGIDSGPVDVYMDGALVADDVAYGDTDDFDHAAGTFAVEVCAAESPAPNPLPPTGCTISADYPNGGVDITVANNESYTVVGQYAGAGEAIGRPTVVAYVVDLDCVEPGQGRIGFLHAANASIVDVFFDATVVFSDVAPQTSPPPTIERVGGTVAITMLIEQTDGTDLFETQVTNLPVGNSSALVFVGNPGQEVSFDLLSIDYPVDDCVPETTTTTTTAPTTTTTVPPVVTPVAVTPRFTG